MQVTKQVARGFGDDVMQGIPIRSLGGTVAVQIESWLKDFTNDRVCHRFSLSQTRLTSIQCDDEWIRMVDGKRRSRSRRKEERSKYR